MKNALQMDPVATGPSDSALHHQGLHRRPRRQGLALRPRSTAAARTVTVSTPDSVSTTPAGPSRCSRRWRRSTSAARTSTSSSAPAATCCRPTASTTAYSLLVLLDNGAIGDQDGGDSAREPTDGAGDDEKVTSFPAVAGDIVFFTTTTLRPDDALHAVCGKPVCRSPSSAVRPTTPTTTAC